jgi:hypothetical protein
MLHDQPRHLVQRWITYRRRLAIGDLFLGPYPAVIAGVELARSSDSGHKAWSAAECRTP